MNPGQELKLKLGAFQVLVWGQRCLRLALRAAWLGIAGYLLAWGLHALIGVPSDPQTWRLAGLCFSVIPLVGILFSWPRLSRLAWAADRKFDLKEQVSTALAVVNTRRGGVLAEGLAVDVNALLPGVSQRVFFRGWFFGRDLFSLMVVLALAAAVIFSAQLAPVVIPQETFQAAALPALPEEPRLEDIIAGRVPGMPAEPGAPNNQAQGITAPAGMTSADLQSIASELQKAGAPLSSQQETKPLADALQALDLKQAAQELQKLADQASTLSQPAKNQLAQALQAAAPALEQADLTDLAADMQAAATSLKNSDSAGQTANLNQVAEALSSLSTLLPGGTPGGAPGNTPGSGVGGGESGSVPQQGQPVDFSRMGGEGGSFELDSGASSASGLLVPGTPTGNASGVASGSITNTRSSSGTVTSLLLPYYYPWKYQNVVSQYFQPQQ